MKLSNRQKEYQDFFKRTQANLYYRKSYSQATKKKKVKLTTPNKALKKLMQYYNFSSNINVYSKSGHNISPKDNAMHSNCIIPLGNMYLLVDLYHDKISITISNTVLKIYSYKNPNLYIYMDAWSYNNETIDNFMRITNPTEEQIFQYSLVEEHPELYMKVLKFGLYLQKHLFPLMIVGTFSYTKFYSVLQEAINETI